MDGGSDPVIGVLIRGGKFGQTQTHREKPREDGGRDWSDASISQGTPGATRS